MPKTFRSFRSFGSEIARAAVFKMSAAHGIEPFAVLGLLGLQALAAADLHRLRILNDVAAQLRQTALST